MDIARVLNSIRSLGQILEGAEPLKDVENAEQAIVDALKALWDLESDVEQLEDK